MTVLLLSACPPGVRGDVTKWMMEIATGVYVGKLSLRTREALWKRVCKHAGSGRAVMVCAARNEQGFVFFVHNTDWQPVDFDGVFLMRRPLPTKKTEGKRPTHDLEPVSDTVLSSDPAGNILQLSARINTALNAPLVLYASETADDNPSAPMRDTSKERELPSSQETDAGDQETFEMQDGPAVDPHASPLTQTSRDDGAVCAVAADPALQNVAGACETAGQQAKTVSAAISKREVQAAKPASAKPQAARKRRSPPPLPYTPWPLPDALPMSFSVLDMETTGLDPERDQIIELACVRVRDGEILSEFQRLVTCDLPLPKVIRDLTGLTDAILTQQGCPLADALPALLSFIGEDCLVGHNVAFDVRFLQTACTEFNLPPPSFQAVDTVQLARGALNNCVANFRLETLARYYDLADHQTHRALPDARLTALLYLKLNEKQ